MGVARSAVRLEVERLIDSGCNIDQIQRVTGVERKRIYGLIYSIRQARGERGIDSAAAAPIATAARNGVMSIGSVQAALRCQPRALGNWLVDNTPNGGTIAETLIAIALDAMNEEKGQ